MFFGFLRSGEMTIPSLHSYDPTVHLNYNNISVDNPANPAIVKVRPMCSKTDPFCHRVDVHVGETGQILCPISALFNYLVVHRKDRGLLFHFSVGSPLLFLYQYATIIISCQAEMSRYLILSCTLEVGLCPLGQYLVLSSPVVPPPPPMYMIGACSHWGAPRLRVL